MCIYHSDDVTGLFNHVSKFCFDGRAIIQTATVDVKEDRQLVAFFCGAGLPYI